jgi:hypothetical protein
VAAKRPKHKWTPEREAVLLQALRVGNYVETAAQYAGISKETYYNWLAYGEAGKPPFKDFLDKVAEAHAHAEIASLTRIQKAAEDGNWFAAAWILERRFPERWARKDHLIHEGGGEDAAPIKVMFGGRYRPDDAPPPK